MEDIKLRLKLTILDNLIWVLVFFVFILSAFFVPKFITARNLMNLINHTAVMGYLVLASGMALIVGTIDLSLESTLAFAPSVVVLLSVKLFPNDMNIFLMFFLTFLFGAGIGGFNGLLITKMKMNPLIATISTMIIIRGLVQFLVPWTIVNVPEKFLFIGSYFIGGYFPVSIIFFFSIYLFFAFLYKYTLFGQFLVSTGGNPTASYIAGINIDRVKILTLVIAGVLASFGGITMSGRIGSVTSQMGSGTALMAFAGAILGGVNFKGGKGTVIGMLGGALILGLFDNVLNLLAINIFIVNITKGCLLLFAVLIDSLKDNLRKRILSDALEKKFKKESGENISVA